MATSSAQKEATRKYQLQLKSMSIRLRPEVFAEYKSAAAALGLSLRALFLRGADLYIEQHRPK